MTAPWDVTVLMRGGATRASSVLARRGTQIAIFDTGMAHHAASFRAALAAEGVSPEDVTLVFNTHAHVDHSHNNARARIFCSARDRDWTRAFHAALSAVDQPGPEELAAFYPEIATAREYTQDYPEGRRHRKIALGRIGLGPACASRVAGGSRDAGGHNAV
jgi:glyoxylase-like metal-dependent hydrolase (beta-lactamase superfamily II)